MVGVSLIREETEDTIRSDNQTAIEHKLHVAGAAGFGSRRGDVFADVRRGHNNLAFADVVVFDKDHLEKVSHLRIVIYHGTNLVNQVYLEPC